ncbi:MAG: 5-formyltetrahydrofolate cyclo-ligase [Rhodospirillaceae bacterium]
MTVSSAADAKMALRRAMLERRRAAHLAGSTDAAVAVARQAVDVLDARTKHIAGYWPLGDELDPRPALEALWNAGALLALPVVAGQGQVLIFRSWKPGDALDQGPFGTQHPNPRAPIVGPHILFVPLIAFDLQGARLGYGAGYYDRTLASLRAQGAVTAIGLAYDAQRVDSVPADPHDQPLDGVITPSGALWFD